MNYKAEKSTELCDCLGCDKPWTVLFMKESKLPGESPPVRRGGRKIIGLCDKHTQDAVALYMEATALS
jgi:hypothetical protein